MNGVPTRRLSVTGSAVVTAYVVIAAVLHLNGWRVRPLFDTLGPPAPYRWVHPPPMFASGNTAPQRGEGRVELVSGRSVSATVATSDGQCLLALPAGALVATPGSASTADVVLTPVDPLALGALPDGLRPVGNACNIRVSLEATPITTLVAPGDVVIEVPEPAQTLLLSADGRAWARAPTQPVNGYSTLGSPTLLRLGYVVAATSAPTPVTSRGGTLVVAISVGLIALVLGSAPVVRSVLRRSSGGDA